MSWVWPDYINPELPLSKQHRKAIHRDAWRLWWADKRNIAIYLLLPAFYLLVVFFAADAGGWVAAVLGASRSVHKLFRAAAPVILFLACFVLGGAVLQRYRFAPCVYRATRERGYDVCLQCGYWLRGLPEGGGRCPECGAGRKAMLQKRE